MGRTCETALKNRAKQMNKNSIHDIKLTIDLRKEGDSETPLPDSREAQIEARRENARKIREQKMATSTSPSTRTTSF